MLHVTCQLQQKPQQQTLHLLTLPNMHSRMFQKAKKKRLTDIKLAEVKYKLKAFSGCAWKREDYSNVE